MHTRTFLSVTLPRYRDVVKWPGFSWRRDDVGATSFMESYLQYAEDPGAGMQLALDYEDDCIATRIVKDWLVDRS